jgi:hypothetical protein
MTAKKKQAPETTDETPDNGQAEETPEAEATPTPDTGQTPQDLGPVDPELKAQLVALQQKSQQATFQLGNLDLQMSALRGQIVTWNKEAQTLVDQESQRLGIPEGMGWQISPEGHAVLLPVRPMPGGAPQGG